MKNLFSTEGRIFGFLDKTGQLILLSILWLLGCLPVITIGTSTTALYYAVVKSIRRDRGSAVKEFLSSYKRNLPRGVLLTVPTLVIAALLLFNISLLKDSGGGLFVGSVILLALLAGSWMYVCPVLSRFTMKTWDAWKLSFVMALRFLPYTLILAIGLGTLAALQLYILPMPTILVIPGVWCYASTFLIEKALRRYMPEKKENDDAWYYES